MGRYLSFSGIILIIVSGVRPLFNQIKGFIMETNEKAASSSSREAVIQGILDEHRSMAYIALDDLMYEAFQKLGKALAETGNLDASETSGRRQYGFSDFALRQIRQHTEAGDLTDWLAAGADGDKMLYLRDFLNLSKLESDEFRRRYPRAFTKWTPDQDEALLAAYRVIVDGGGRVQWREFSRRFERNPNAIKLRLEHLGVDLGADAGHSRRPGGPDR